MHVYLLTMGIEDDFPIEFSKDNVIKFASLLRVSHILELFY